MTKEEKIKVAKWYICNHLIGIDTETYNLVKNNKINNLDELEEIIKKKGKNGLQLCLRCLHVTNEICNRCDGLDDQGFRFRYKYFKNRMDEENNPKDDFVFKIK